MGKETAIKTKTLKLGIFLLLLVLLGAIVFIQWSTAEKEASLEQELETRLEILAKGRVEVISTWLSGLERQGDRVVRSEVFQLYAAEADAIEEDISRLVGGSPLRSGSEGLQQLAAQLPMMETLLKEFVEYSGFLAGRVVHRSGKAYISTQSSIAPLTGNQKDLVTQCLEKKRGVFAPLRFTASGLVLDMALPIFPPQQHNRFAESKPVAALLLNRAVTDKISEILAGIPYTDQGHQTRLVQTNNGVYQEIVPWLPDRLRPIPSLPAAENREEIPFAVRQEIENGKRVYSLGVKVPEPGWWIVQEQDYRVARADLHSYRRTAIFMTILGALLLGTAFGAVWWRLSFAESERIRAWFRDLNSQLERQRSLLKSIYETAPDFIALKSAQGTYEYVNPAMAGALGRDAEQVVGQDDVALFGYDTGKRLERSDHNVYAHGQDVSVIEQVYLQSQPYTLQFSKAPHRDSQGNIVGIVSIAKDITAMVAAQERHERLVRKTVEALVRTVEMSDPYLAGHSRLMGALAVALGDYMEVSSSERTAMEMAANLSQIGKLFIDESILTKTGTLTDEEREIMQQHVEHAERILCGIDFEMPVLDLLTQMNEHLDGSGYPSGKTAGEISLPARILAVANAFCAMIRPRAYRPAMQIGQALVVLEQHAGTIYDGRVLENLRLVLNTRQGERLLEQAKQDTYRAECGI